MKTESRGPWGVWRVEESDLVGLTPERARDLLIQCFYEAQADGHCPEGGAHSREVYEEEMRRTIMDVIRLSFEDLGLDYDRPTPECIDKVVECLRAIADQTGTPRRVIEHHLLEFAKVQRALTEAGRAGALD